MLNRKHIMAFILVIAMSVQLVAPSYTVTAASMDDTMAVDSGENTSTGTTGGTEQSESTESTDGAGTTEPAGSETTEGAGDAAQPEGTEEAPAEEQTENSAGDTAENQDVALLADGGYAYTTLGALREALLSGSIKADIAGEAPSPSIDITDAQAFVFLSQTDPEVYKNATISLNYAGGGMDITAGQFNGLGSETVPFQGTLSGTGWAVTINHALFNGLSTEATLPENLTLNWKGTCDADAAMLASKVVGTEVREGSESKAVTWNLFISATAVNADAERVFPALIHDAEMKSDSLSLNVTYDAATDSSNKKIKATVNGTDNAGLICNTLSSGTLKIGTLTKLPESITVQAQAGSAGGLAGLVKTGATLSVSEAFTLPSGTTITGTRNAGGLIGATENLATLEMKGAITLNGVTVTGGNAGGFIGSAQNLKLTLGEDVTEAVVIGASDAPLNVIGTNAGGVFGAYAYNDSTGATGIFDSIDSSCYQVNGVKLNCNAASGNAGGLIGVLSLGNDADNKDFTVDAKATVTSTLAAAQTDTNYGGLLGSVNGTDTDALSTLNVIGVDGTNSANLSITASDKPFYCGGLIGSANQVYIPVKDAGVLSNETTDSTTMFGGAVGYEGGQSVVDVQSLKVEAKYPTGGGVVGSVDSGAAVQLSGTVDMSNAIPSGDRAAQIVGTQTSGLIYATDTVTLKRCPASRYNDIGNYGEVIRLGTGTTESPRLDSDLITIDGTTHKVVLKTGILDDVSGDIITLANVNQFALLAVMIQTEGKFSSAGEITRDVLVAKNITLDANIDLAGTGIIGLMRDIENQGAFTGTFDGGGHTISLAIGEAWGKRGDADVTIGEAGSGQIYSKSSGTEYFFHNRIGLFSNVKGATVQNITLAGTAFVGADQSSDNLLFGGFTAAANTTFTVGDGTATSTNVTTKLDVSIDGSKDAYVGGLIGVVYADPTGVTLHRTAGNAVLTNTNTDSSNGIRLGGLIGRLSTGMVTVDDGTTLGGTITSNTTTNARVGGLIADTPSDANSRTVNINNLIVDGQKINVNASAEAGGLLGYEWHSTDVYFADQNNADTKGLTVQGASALTNTDAGAFGGLVYRANGYWQINKIALEKATFTADSSKLTSGLLVCRGDAVSSRALYLELTSKDAYTIDSEKVSISTNGTSFDELAAYTASSASNIVANGNGIISIATAETNGVRDKIDMVADAANCNTYQNVTKNSNTGNQWAVNPCSRYYYNLDKYRSNNDNVLVDDADVNSSEKLLLWSAGRYAADNLRTYFGGYDITKSYKITGTLDMSGYSYYPISLSEADHVSVDGATITFDNATIEAAEELTTGGTLDSVERVTSGTLSAHSQHYLMHSGLFYNYSHDSTPTSSITYTLKVNNTQFSGSVGMREKTTVSGALLCGNVAGKAGQNCYATMAVAITDVTLTDLYINKVNGTTTYAPLLMNTFGSYTSIAVSGVTADNRMKNAYTAGTVSGSAAANKYAATSLIGRVGGSNAVNMAVSFDKIEVEGKKTDSIFKNATLLEWFQYNADTANSSGTYNFNLADDWNESTKEHRPFNVTYGWEISNSVENKDKQHWYYDKQSAENIYVNPDSYPTTTEYTFSKDDYLAYVADSVAVTTAHTNYHELKVNIPVADLLEGCGTYSDPYVITNAGELEAVAKYLQDGNIISGWRINIDEDITKDSCDGTGHVLYVAGASGWVSQEDSASTKTSGVVREYLRNAYYQLGDKENTALTFGENFIGLGTSSYAFRGVIIGYSEDNTQQTTVTITQNSTATGLINYSYGSVVKRLKIAYNGSRTITTDGFGGVINHIMGGDNIIDNVTTTGSIDQTKSGDIHLKGVGGYVGIIEGGGVIFRSMTDQNGWSALGADTNSANFYQNPFVGRVLDGFAFYEQVNTTDTVNSLNNTDKNYTIVTLDTSATGDIVATFSKDKYPEKTQRQGSVDVKSKQGLLILSAIAASGAAAGGTNTSEFLGTVAYYGVKKGTYGNGDYGKTRNAAYDEIGDVNSADIAVAVADDTVTPCPPTTEYGTEKVNKPYLVSQYTDASGYTMLFCAPYTRFSLTMDSGVTYDMSSYGNGYRGIGGRYASNAVGEVSDEGTIKTYNADRYTPYILGIDCGGATLNVNQTVKEYSDDNYPATAVGGLMPFLQQDNKTYSGVDKTIKDLTVSGSVSLTYFDKNGSETTADKTNVGVGGVFGRSANRDGNRDQDYSSAISNIQLLSLSVEGPKYAGGLFGAIGIYGNYASTAVQHTRKASNIFAVTLTNCAYDNLQVTANSYAGGFIGYSGANGSTTTQANVGVNTIKVTDNAHSDVGSSSTSGKSVITTKSASSYAGGLIGYSEIGLDVNSTATNPVTLDGVTVRTTNTTGTSYSGALVGRELGSYQYAVWERSVNADNVNVTNCIISQATGTTGGLLGSVEDISTTVTNSEVSSNTITGTKSGGLLGELLNAAGTLKGSNLLWKDNTITGSTTAGNWVGVGKDRTIQLAGVSRQATTDDAKAAVLANDIGDTSYANEKTSYIVYADYKGTNNDKTETTQVEDDTYNATNTFQGIPSTTATACSITVGECIAIDGIGFSGFDNSIINVVEKDGRTIVTGKIAGQTTIGGVTITVQSSGEEILIQNGKYKDTSNNDVEIPRETLGKKTYPYWFEGYVNNGQSALGSGSGSSVLIFEVEPGEYQISFATKQTSAKGVDNGTRFRVAYYQKDPSKDMKPYMVGSQYYYYMSGYDKDFSGTSFLGPSEGDITLYASFDPNSVFMPSGADGINRYTDAGKNSSDSNTITFADSGYVAVTYRDNGGSSSSKPTGITVKKMNAGTSAKTYSEIMIDSASNPKTSYTVNDILNGSGLVIMGKNSDGDGYSQISDSQYTLSASMDTAGLKTVTVTLNADVSPTGSTVSTTYQIAVNALTDVNKHAVNVVRSPMANNETYFTVPTLNETDGTTTTLYGDGAIWQKETNVLTQETKTSLMAETIQSDWNGAPGIGNSFYTNQNGVGHNAFSTDNLSTFALSNVSSTGELPEIPLLKVSGGSGADQEIASYLDVVTNGGYSHAVKQGAVTATSKTYAWSEEKFTATSDTPSLTVSNSGTNNISYSTGSRYDNDKMQLTVLAVTFSAGTTPDYTVYVPIVVERILEVDMTATFQNGTVFAAETYNSAELQHGVVDSHGSAITAYITYQYNSKNGSLIQYGWQSYIEGGGNVAQRFNKTIEFGDASNFPEGTEFLLVDCQNQDKVYHYTTTTAGTKTISLSEFKSEENEAFASKSMGEVMNAVVAENVDGKFVQTVNGATVIVNGQGYRLANADDTGTHYSITIDEKQQPTENYYLVIRTPQTSNDVVGAISTRIECGIPKNINYVTRLNHVEDIGENSERTFKLYSGYQQTLAETDTRSEYIGIPAQTAYEIPMIVQDTITWNKGNYRQYDKLYQKLQVNLERYNNNALESTTSFPSGTQGTVTFQVKGYGTYFYYLKDSTGEYWIATTTPATGNTVTGTYEKCKIDSREWTTVSGEVTITPLSYEWISDGDTMNLIVGTGNTTEQAVSLSAVRDKCETEGTCTFSVTASMDVSMSASQVAAVIPAGKLVDNVADQYAKLNYVSQLSSTADSLSYSIQSDRASGVKGYYLETEGNASLNYKASDITQLGINLGSEEEISETHTISTQAEYSLSGVDGLEEKLQNATAIRFTLSVERRNGDDRGDYTIVADSTALWNSVTIGNNGVASNDTNMNVWTYELENKGDGSFDYYDSKTKMVNVPIQIKVNTNLRDNNQPENYFANYHASLVMSIVTGDEEEYQANDYVTYTITNIKTDFIPPTTVTDDLMKVF